MVYRPTPPLSNARIRALWSDLTLTKDTLPGVAGCSYDTLQKRAKTLGLGARHNGRAKLGGTLFRAMCRAGVSQREIAGHFGVSQSGVSRAAARLGLDAAASAQSRLTLHDFLQHRLRLRAVQDRTRELLALGHKPLQPVYRTKPAVKGAAHA